MAMASQTYNLDIHEYSLDDLFNLFEIPYTTEIRKEHIRIAKQKVIMSHPDKSRLPPEYFIFYKKAFEMIVHYYESQNRTDQVVPTVSSKETELIYDPIHSSHNINTNISASSASTSKVFNKKFNELFEANEMMDKPDTNKNEWFRQEENPFAQYSVNNTSQINQTLEKIKQQDKERAMALYRGVTPLNTCGSYGNKLYGDDEEESDGYICSDPFSKLKYDDLRKVHKDQTVFSITEKDISKVKKYDNVDQYQRSRESSYIPLEKTEAERILQHREKEMQEKIMHKQYQSDLRTLENIEKSKKIQATFLRIGR